jgi:hypothetical protein
MNATKKVKRSAAPQRVYQLRVSLIDAQPSIWRRLWVPDLLTLAQLDRVIQAAMGWTNSHLHEFQISGQRYGMPADDEIMDDIAPPLDDRHHKVGDVLGTTVPSFSYVYDFGDGWEHTVVVEQIMLPNDLNTWPLCLDGCNACPPEDVGGFTGYEEFLQAMRDPTHEEHDAMWKWCGGPFDPTGFDVNAANAAIRALIAGDWRDAH